MLTDVIWQFSESAGVLGPFERSVCIFNALVFLFGCCSRTDFISLKLVVRRAEADHGGHLTADPWGSIGLSLRELVVAERGVSQGVPHGCGHRVVVPDGLGGSEEMLVFIPSSEPATGWHPQHATPDDHTTTPGVCCVAKRGKRFTHTMGRRICGWPLTLALWSLPWAGSHQQSPASPDVQLLG